MDFIITKVCDLNIRWFSRLPKTLLAYWTWLKGLGHAPFGIVIGEEVLMNWNIGSLFKDRFRRKKESIRFNEE